MSKSDIRKNAALNKNLWFFPPQSCSTLFLKMMWCAFLFSQVIMPKRGILKLPENTLMSLSNNCHLLSHKQVDTHLSGQTCILTAYWKASHMTKTPQGISYCPLFLVLLPLSCQKTLVTHNDKCQDHMLLKYIDKCKMIKEKVVFFSFTRDICDTLTLMIQFSSPSTKT